MILLASLLVALVVTSFLVSKVAMMLRAKRPEMGWVFFATLVGSILSGAVLIGLSLFVPTLDPMIMIIFSVITILFVSSLAFKLINQMSWGSAITTNVANVVVTLVMVVAAVVLNGESLKETFNIASHELQSSINVLSGVTPSDIGDSVEIIDQENDDVSEENVSEMVEFDEDSSDLGESEEKESAVKETDFMTKAAALAFEAKKTKGYVEPKFRIVKLSQARSVIGFSVRVLNSHGNTTIGLLTGVRGGKLVISKRLSAGEAIVPLNLASVRKLEVYR